MDVWTAVGGSRVSTEVTFWHSAEYGSDFRLNSGENTRNYAEFRGISPELSRNHFRSQKIPRNSVSAEFRGHPRRKRRLLGLSSSKYSYVRVLTWYVVGEIVFGLSATKAYSTAVRLFLRCSLVMCRFIRRLYASTKPASISYKFTETLQPLSTVHSCVK
jgi:hypothetical protein